MGFSDIIKKITGSNTIVEVPDDDNVRKQIGLEVKLPGCEEFVPLGKSQYNRVYLDDIGPRLLIVADECAELLEPSGVKTTDGKEEDALKAEIVGLMKSITQLGRSAGIHMVLAPLRLSTVIPLYNGGYTTMKEVQLGDLLIDKNGNPTEVISLAPIKISESMYEIEFILNEEVILIGADGDHNFPIFIGDSLNYNKVKVSEMYDLMKDNDIYVLGQGAAKLKISKMEKIYNEIVRCIEVNNEEHIFAICGEGGGLVNNTRDFICSYNTQRNDASIIPGVIQNNPVDIETRIRVLRKIEE